MRRLICTLLTLCLLSQISLFAGVEVHCKVRYLQEIYHPPVLPTYIETPSMGKTPIHGTGRDGYYEKVWSNSYYLDLIFFSGFELNDYYNKASFEENTIIGIVSWENGGHSVIEVERWITEQEVLDERELKYTSDGKRITKVNGYDTEGRYWEIIFQ